MVMMSHPEFRKAMGGPMNPAQGAELMKSMTNMYRMAFASGSPESGASLVRPCRGRPCIPVLCSRQECFDPGGKEP